jgi:N6-adenosine-specific RNA methylase IME4
VILLEQFSVIYADPPWRFSNNGVKGAADKHYSTMSIDEICALPVADIAAPDSALFLWSTFPMLREAFRVIDAWQFTYKCAAFIWLKSNKHKPGWAVGTGFWTRANAEICLLATKGSPKRKSKSVHQIIVAPRMEHSRKPEEARERIIQLFGDLPRIELFARQATHGWAVWGNEVESDISL